MLASGDKEFAAWYAAASPEEAPVEPELEAHQRYYWQAWQDIRGDRHVDGMGAVGPIPYLTISRYAEDHYITGTDFLRFKTIIKAMDAEFLDYIAKTRPKAPEK